MCWAVGDYVGACVDVLYGVNVVYRKVCIIVLGCLCIWTVYCFLYYMKSV